MTITLRAAPISQDAIAGLAEVIEAVGEADKHINQDLCGRFHDRAFLDIEGDAGPGQGVNIGHNVWHGVLCPLSDIPLETAMFMVVDRVTDGPNLQEYWFKEPITIER